MVKKFTDHSIISNFTYKQDIKKQLLSMGIRRGMVVLLEVKQNFSGNVLGNEQSIIEAVMEVVGYEGTIVIPTFTPYLIDPSQKGLRGDRKIWKDIRKFTSGFDLKLSMPVKEDGLAHQFLRNEGVLRSYHPLYSFAAWGKYAKLICNRHPLHFGLNEESPLGKLVEFQAKVILIDKTISESVMLRGFQYKNIQQPIRVCSVAIMINQQTKWEDILDVQVSNNEVEKTASWIENQDSSVTTEIGDISITVFDTISV